MILWIFASQGSITNIMHNLFSKQTTSISDKWIKYAT